MIKPFHLTFLVIIFLHVNFIVAQDVNMMRLEEELLLKQDTANVNQLNTLCWELRRKDPGQAVKYGLKAIQTSRDLNYAQGLATAYKNTGVCYWITSDYARAGFYYNEAMTLFTELNDKQEIGNIQNLYGLLDWSRGDFAAAILNYRQSHQTFNRINDREGMATVLGNLGIIYYELGRYDDALQNYLNALQLYLLLGDNDAAADVYNNIGLVYSQQGNFKMALKYYGFSLGIDLRKGNRVGQAESYTNIGVCYFRMGLTDSAAIYHARALALFEELGDKKGFSHSAINLGEIAFAENNYDLANSYFSSALDLKKNISDQLGEVIVKNHLGCLRMKQGLTAESRTLFEEALALAELIGSLRYAADAHRYLSLIYETENPALALYHFKSYADINDSLVSEETSTKLFNLELGLETLEKEQEIELLEKESELDKAESRMLLLASALVALLGLTLVIYQRTRRRQERVLAEKERENAITRSRALRLELQNKQQELDFNRKTLDAYTQKLVEKNNLLEVLRQQLAAIQPNGGVEENERIKKINELIASRIITDDDWEEFKQLYAKVYPSFFIRLKEKFPLMTQAELRLAALIRLKMTNREIAAMVGISADSVKKSRQRLRKKLGLSDEEEKLDEVILNIAD